MQLSSRVFTSLAPCVLLATPFLSQSSTAVSVPTYNFVSPPELTNVEGNGQQNVTDAARAQEIHPATSFALLDGTAQMFEIFGFRFRPDGVLMAPEVATYSDFRLTLAVAPFDSLVLNFEDNLEDSINPTVVFDGPVTITTENIRLPDGTMTFDQSVLLQTPFPYSPRQGNLLWDYDVSATNSPPVSDFSGTGGLDYIQQAGSGSVGRREGWTLPIEVSLRPVLHGDFDGSGMLDAADIDLLSAATGTDSPLLDIDQDGSTDEVDRQLWISDLAETFPGDANLDGKVEFADFLSLSESFGQEAGWSAGDFDGNAVIEFADFLALSQNFGSERSAAVAVPEPSSYLVIGIGAVSLMLMRRRYC